MDQMLFLAFTSFAEARPGAREAAKPFFLPGFVHGASVELMIRMLVAR
jgi:hypothetical protein